MRKSPKPKPKLALHSGGYGNKEDMGRRHFGTRVVVVVEGHGCLYREGGEGEGEGEGRVRSQKCILSHEKCKQFSDNTSVRLYNIYGGCYARELRYVMV
jgi:hypothetical protein